MCEFRYVHPVVAMRWKHGLLEKPFEKWRREVYAANGLRTGFLCWRDQLIPKLIFASEPSWRGSLALQ